MKKSKEDIIKQFNELVKDNTASEFTTFLEDLSDSFESQPVDVTALTAERDKYKNDYDDLVKKYRDRFSTSIEQPSSIREEPKPISINDLFK